MIRRSPTRTDTQRPGNASLVGADEGLNLDVTNMNAQDQSVNHPGIRHDVAFNVNQIPNVEISAAAVKLPQFWTNCPEAWFIHAEMQFTTKGILQDKTKYEHIVTALPQEVIMTVLDVIQNPPAVDRYHNLKKNLIDRHTISENRKLDKILSDSEIGDRRPSEFYRSLALLAGNNFSTDVLKKIWLRKLPKSLNVALTGSNLSDVNRLMELADNLWEVLQADEVASVTQSSPTPKKDFADIGKVVEGLVQVTSNICEGFKTLSLEVSAMRRQFEEYQYGPNQRYFSRSRSGSRNRSTSKKWLCRFHYRYGRDARRCEQPCSYVEQSDDSKN